MDNVMQLKIQGSHLRSNFVNIYLNIPERQKER